jgi:hypothetical protein
MWIQEAGRSGIDRNREADPFGNGVRRDESRDPVEGQPDDERVELDCSADGDRRIDNGTYRCWVARDVRPEQALVLMQLARGQVNNRRKWTS